MYKTAWCWWKAGKLPFAAERMATGTVIVHLPRAMDREAAALYASVSSRDQQTDLARQIGRLTAFATLRRREALIGVRGAAR